MKNSNLNIVITGGGSSIGASLVKKLSKKNRVCVLDIKFEISKNKNIFLYKCDVTKNKIIKKTFKKIYSRFKHIDVLINNAGWIATFPIYNPLKVKNKIHSMNLWNKILAINLGSVFNCTSIYCEHQIQNRQGGLIINFSSISANGAINQSAYAAAKAGVIALTSTWSKELSIFNIRSTCISPGIVNSESTKKDLKANHVEGWKKKIPLKRFANMNEIYMCVDFIIKNNYFNGKCLRIDGGLEY
jgi:3-oxoacyl-[acyl-carrier protein] reductase